MSDNLQDSAAPAHGQQVITACAFIHHNFDGVKKVFIPKRAATKKFMPGIYEVPGGHIDFGENIVDGLKREIMEELGMRLRVGEPFAAFDYTNHIKGSHSLEVIYFATFEDPIEQIRLDPANHSGYIWLAEDELHKIASGGKSEDDDELRAIRRGFQLLGGSTINYGI